MTNKPTVIYHRSDFDGIFCREIARKFLGEEVNYEGLEYGDSLPEVSPDADLYILDFSVPELMNHPQLVWIDHHKTAIEKFPTTIVGYRIDGVAACRLAWQWFTRPAIDDGASPRLPGKQDYVDRLVVEPWSVRLAGEYDIWDKRDQAAELFQHGLRSENLDWNRVFADEAYIGHLLSQGTALQYARGNEDTSLIRNFAYDLQFEGLNFLACNLLRCNSITFKSGVKPEHDGLLAFGWTGDKWRISLYGVEHKPDVDLSVIAQKYGGGGHKQACGFTCETLPFSL